MKEVPEQLRKLRRQYLRYQQAEIIYSISHKKLFELASDAGAIYRIDGTVLIDQYFCPGVVQAFSGSAGGPADKWVWVDYICDWPDCHCGVCQALHGYMACHVPDQFPYFEEKPEFKNEDMQTLSPYMISGKLEGEELDRSIVRMRVVVIPTKKARNMTATNEKKKPNIRHFM